jgi:putative ABC transport system permease protein
MTVESLRQDLTYGWRRLVAAPGFTAVAVLTLALGIGANTALFSLVNGLLLKPIPIPTLSRLAALTSDAASVGAFSLSADEYQFLVDSRLPAVDRIFVSNPLVGVLSGREQADVVSGELVSGAYFYALGVAPRAGRLLEPRDDLAADAGTPIVISERLWRRWFAADPSAIGQVLRMAGYPLTLVGVAPDSFRGTWLPTMLTADVWIPVTATSHVRTIQGSGAPPDSHRISGRTFVLLHPGASLAQVSSAVAAIPGDRTHEPLMAVPAERAILFAAFARTGLALGSAVLALSALVFLIACANLTNLLLARGAARAGEVAVRLATGASRARIFRLLLTETCLLVAVAGAAALALAFGATRVMTAVPLPALQGIVIRFDPSPDLRVFAYAFAAALVTALAIGVVPAWRASRSEPLRVLASTGAGAFSTSRGNRLRTWLVASQVAMSIVLLVGAGLYARSAIKSLQMDPGFEFDGAVMASVDLRMHRMDEARGRQALRRLLEAARRLPGAQEATLTSGLPASRQQDFTFDLAVEGQPPPFDAHRVIFGYLRVSPEFFHVVGIPIGRGRGFNELDAAGAPRVAVVSEAMAAMLWPGQDPIGRRLSIAKNGPMFAVVGVARDTFTDLTGTRRVRSSICPSNRTTRAGCRSW